MEAAATLLRQPRVQVLLGRILVENLVVDDAAAAEIVRERVEAGDDAARIVSDAVEIGTRILARSQADDSVDVLRQQMERTSEQVVEQLRAGVEEAFGPESGHVTKVLHKEALENE